ncbi:NRDE family protein [Geomonas sp. RF6]|uniref:NRDE family protein n=1 Tax=Geomonas sp. RF6 TaxID=2897342 RepID=UPI001E4A7E61|nr:NRDE family protein [Geomonas sp. RF6]UFS71548.1 NRDE family protein [Geomonas sp. RF6]
MCLILLANRVHPRYPLVLAANRDELYARPSAPAAFWEDAPGVLAGKDLLQGGTWLGVTRQGRLAAVTNLRDGRPFRADAPTRGNLVTDFLFSAEPPPAYVEELGRRGGNYNGFNLLLGDRSDLYLYSNSADSSVRLTPGFHGISNHGVEAPWPKTMRGVRLLAQALAAPFSVEDLLAILSDATIPDSATAGGEEEGETQRSPIFMRGAAFGTRCSTVLLLDREGTLTFVERSFRDGTLESSTATFQFRLSLP